MTHSRSTFSVMGMISIILSILVIYRLRLFSLPFPIRIENKEVINISRTFQNSLHNLQTSSNCDDPEAIYCGHDSRHCGLGCELHYRIICAILSNALQIPFFHLTPWWPYTDPWNKYFKPIGANCSVNESTSTKFIHWTSDDIAKVWDYRPLASGLLIPYDLFGVLKDIFPNDESEVFWLLGQYAHFVFQLNSEANVEISKWREKLNISRKGSSQNRNPLIGMHVRRTDKSEEAIVMRTPDEFMEAAEQYRNLIDSGVKFDTVDVFVASEDHTMLPTFQAKFASEKWNIVGFPDTYTYRRERDRESQLIQIIRDITILSECDFVICTFSSNVCRLILALQAYQDSENGIIVPDASHRIVSLDGPFFFETFERYYMPLRAVPSLSSIQTQNDIE